MQDTPQPTDQHREEFRALLSEVIATLHDVQPYVQGYPAETFEAEDGIYLDPAYEAARDRLNSTVKMLTTLRGYAANEWLHAYIERKEAMKPRTSCFLITRPSNF